MNSDTSQLLASAVRSILTPVIRILLRNGIAFGTFSELARKVYTDVAYEEFKPVDGKKQSVSHVSALTGLTRKETRRLLDSDLSNGSEDNHRYNRAARVISGWINDDEYLDDKGTPLLLSIDQGNPCFASLVRKYSGDITTQSMLKVLNAAGSIEITDDGIKLVNSAYLPGNDSAEAIAILGDDSNELISTIDHNMTHEASEKRFQRKVSESKVAQEKIDELKLMAAEKSQHLLEELDHWLAQTKTKGEEEGNPNTSYVSVGIYFFERSENQESNS